MTREELLKLDKEHLWHPYTQHSTHPTFVPIHRAEGVWVWDINGKKYLDAISSWWVASYGHCHPDMIAGITRQLNDLDHILFGGFTHRSAVQLARELVPRLPEGLSRIFFSDNGSTAVEVALKAAIQYHHNAGQRRTKILALEGAFHGDTFGAMSASGIGLFSQMFEGHLLEVVRIPLPRLDSDYLGTVEQLISSRDFACFIFEPLVQGASGMRMYSGEGLSALLGLCRSYGLLCIADEVMTGFGKLGSFLASDQVEEKPDIICLAKGLTGGVLPMALTVFREEIFQGFGGDIERAFFHGHTFTANPVGCAAALSSLRLFNSPQMQENLARLCLWQKEKARQFRGHPTLEDVRVCGSILAMDLRLPTDQAYYGEVRNWLYNQCMSRGIILRPVGKCLYTLPPYVIDRAEFDWLYDQILEILEEKELNSMLCI